MAKMMSFIYQQRYLARKLVKNKASISKINIALAKKFNLPIGKITVHSDFNKK